MPLTAKFTTIKMKADNKHDGFAILEILLVVVTLFFIVAISWVVLRHQKAKQPQTVSTVDASKTLFVKGWGIYLNLPDNSTKVSYKPVNANGKTDIDVSSDELDKFATGHKECSAANLFDAITRTKEGESALGFSPADTKAFLDKKLAAKTAKKIGSFYYYGDRPTISPCLGSNIADIQKLNNQAYDLLDKLPTFADVQATL
jgi:hypothetical protein